MSAGANEDRGTAAGAARFTLGRIVLGILTLYTLVMIVPDFVRIVRPLGSFGLATNADGFVYDVQGPFETEDESPAWRAGVRVGDRLDLVAMRCIPLDTELCASSLSLWGGVTYVVPGRAATLKLLSEAGQPSREIKLHAEPRPRSVAVDIVTALTQIAGVLVVLGAAYLVWIRPGPMTWGFFAYVMYFNPGASFQFEAWLQQSPQAQMAQEVIFCVLQAAGYTGLLLFALRAPVDRAEGRWRIVQGALPVLAVLFLAVELASLGSVFGFPTEFAMRATLLIGFAVSAAAIAILVARRRLLSPRDYQRIRWVIWGCLIGLPANLIAAIWQETSLPYSLFGAGAATDDIAGLFYLINGILCLFVVEAVRRPTVVSVWIPLRRATVLGLLLSLPVFFIHEEFGTVHEWTQLPDWAWVLLASVLVFILSRAHEFATELAERLFDRDFIRAEHHFVKVGEVLEHADSFADIERLLVDEPAHALKLGSAAAFREEHCAFRRRASKGWRATDAELLTGAEPMLAERGQTGPFALKWGNRRDPRNPSLPEGVARPVLGLTIGNARRCFALALYSGHEDGTELETKEVKLLQEFARKAAHAYAQAETDMLRSRIAGLEDQLARPGAAE